MPRNVSTVKGREIALTILGSKEYQNGLWTRAVDGTLPPAMELRLWDMAWGKPPEEIRLMHEVGDLEDLSIEELDTLAADITLQLREHAKRLRPADLDLGVH